MIFTINATFQDLQQRKALSMWQQSASDLATILSEVQLRTLALQTMSQAKLFGVHFLAEPDVAVAIPDPAGNVLKQLLIFMETIPDPIQGKRFIYKIRIIDPDPGLYDPSTLQFLPDGVGGQFLIDNFLSHTCDVRGLGYSSVINGQLIQFLGGL